MAGLVIFYWLLCPKSMFWTVFIDCVFLIQYIIYEIDSLCSLGIFLSDYLFLGLFRLMFEELLLISSRYN